jgi:hypothetical protein
MRTTRSAAKKQEQLSGAPPAEAAQPGSKHKTGEGAGSPSPKRPKKEDDEQQQNAANKEPQEPSPKPEPKAAKADDTSAAEPEGHGDTPSNILEKGIIYFFFRSRVNIDAPSSTTDIARSHIILRPIEQDAKLGSGPIGDAGNSRLCLIPKKTLPQSGRDRWTAFVEKTGASFQQLKDEFLASSEYETKTAGTRHTPAATPVGEGV